MRLELNSDSSSRAVENEKKIELKYTTMVEGARTVHTDTLRKKSNYFFPANSQHTQTDFVSVLNAIFTNMNGLYAQLSMVLYTMVQSVFVWFFFCRYHICTHTILSSRDSLHLRKHNFAHFFSHSSTPDTNKMVIILRAYVLGKRCNYIYFRQAEANAQTSSLVGRLQTKR